MYRIVALYAPEQGHRPIVCQCVSAPVEVEEDFSLIVLREPW